MKSFLYLFIATALSNLFSTDYCITLFGFEQSMFDVS